MSSVALKKAQLSTGLHACFVFIAKISENWSENLFLPNPVLLFLMKQYLICNVPQAGKH